MEVFFCPGFPEKLQNISFAPANCVAKEQKEEELIRDLPSLLRPEHSERPHSAPLLSENDGWQLTLHGELDTTDLW